MKSQKLRQRFFSAGVVGLLGIVLFQASAVYAEENPKDKIYIRNEKTEEKVKHPRDDGYWLQYYPLTTALRKNVVISDVITPDSKWENWAGEEVETHSMESENADNYDDSHNHYQNLLSEVLNFSEGTNAVSIWGDSSAVQNGSKAWGGFFSARSNMQEFVDNDTFSVSAKYSCGFSNTLISSIIVGERYLNYFTTITEDRLWQLLAKPAFRWRNRSGLSMNVAKAA